MYSDLTWWIYLLTAVISAYGTGLFVWWSWLNGFRSSSVFLYTLLWLAGTFILSGVNLYARGLTLTDPQLFRAFTDTLWWPARNLIILVVLIVLCAHMSVRACTWARHKNGIPRNRRAEDRD
jgi:hypothetical protein